MNEIVRLDLQDEGLLSDLWSLQHKAYRLEAQMIGFHEIPPLMETRDMLRRCAETFYGCFDDEGELLGAVAVTEETPGLLVVCRMMVSPDHFRQGIASALLEHVFQTYGQMDDYAVSTGAKNAPAMALYEKHGFRPFESEEVAPGVILIEFRRSGQADGEVTGKGG